MTDFPDTCDRALELLHLHVGGDLDAEPGAALEQHLARCAACSEAARHVEQARRIFFEVAGTDGAEPIALWADVRHAMTAEGLLPAPTGSRGARRPEAVDTRTRAAARSAVSSLPPAGAGAAGLRSDRAEGADGRGMGPGWGSTSPWGSRAQGRWFVAAVAAIAVGASAGLFALMLESARSMQGDGAALVSTEVGPAGGGSGTAAVAVGARDGQWGPLGSAGAADPAAEGGMSYVDRTRARSTEVATAESGEPRDTEAVGVESGGLRRVRPEERLSTPGVWMQQGGWTWGGTTAAPGNPRLASDR